MSVEATSQSSASFYVLGGPMRRDAESYVERQADTDLYADLSQGEYCHVLTSRQMGKTSLVVQTAARLRQNGFAVSYLDVSSNGKNLTPKQWYHGLLNQIAQDLDLERDLNSFWSSKEQQVSGSLDDQPDALGPHQIWERAIKEVVLARCPHKIVIFVDEVDFVLSLPFSTDEFLAGIRAFYTRRAFNSDLDRLTFCLLGVVAPTDLIRDARTTPFNIGRRIELNDFTEAEVSPLAKGLMREGDEKKQLMKRVLYWTAGQPYLTQRLCREVAEDRTVRSPGDVDRVCKGSFFSARAQKQDLNLTFVSRPFIKKENIKEADRAGFLSDDERAGLLTLYALIRNDNGVWDGSLYKRLALSLRRTYGWARGHNKVSVDDVNPLVSTLQISGITRVVDGHLFVRNRIYHRVFDQDWVEVNMPGADRRRQRAAFRSGLLRATTYAALIVLAFGVLTAYAFRMKHEADNQRSIADNQKSIAIEERAIAEEERRRAQEAAQRADKNALEAEAARKKAERKGNEANYHRSIAVKQRIIADQQRRKAEAMAQLARSEAVRTSEALRNEQYALLKAQEQRAEADKQREEAKKQGTEAVKQRDTNRHLAYTAHVNLANQEFNNRNRPRAQQLLRIHDNEDLCGFEWYHLLELCHPEVATLQNASAGILSLAFSPLGKFASVDLHGEVKLWDSATHRELRTLTVRSDPVYSAAFSPDGTLIAIGTADRTVELWDMATGQGVAALKGHVGAIRSIAFSPDGRLIATGSDDLTVKVWDSATYEEVATLTGHTLPVYSVAFSPNGMLGSGSLDKTVKLWDSNTHQELATLNHTSYVYSVAFSPDGKLLATGSEDGLVGVWDTSKRKLLTYAKEGSAVYSVAFSPDGKVVASGSSDKAVKLWDSTTGEELSSVIEHPGSVISVAFSPNGSMLVTGSSDKTIKIWDTAKQLRRSNLNDSVSAAFSPNNKSFATGSEDGTVRVWNLSTHERPLLLKGHSSSVLCIAFSPDGEMLATGSRDRTVRLWDASTGRELANLTGHSLEVISVAFSPTLKVLASGSLDNTVKIWDTESHQELKTLLGHTDSVRSVAFSRDGKLLATGSADKKIKLWDPTTWEEITTLSGGDSILSIAFSPNGLELASTDVAVDQTVKLWDLSARKGLRSLKGHSSPITTVEFSPDGRTLASGSDDGTVKLWDTATAEELLTFRGYAPGVKFVRFSQDSHTLAIGTSDGKVQFRYGIVSSIKAKGD